MTNTRTVSSSRTQAAAWTARVLLAAFTCALAVIVLLPSDGHQVLGLVDTFASFASRLGVPYWIAFTVIEFGANIVLFVPLGVLLPVAVHAQNHAAIVGTIAAGAAVSVCIELVQLGIPGRVSSPADVLANTLGTALGVVLFLVIRARLRGEPRRLV